MSTESLYTLVSVHSEQNSHKILVRLNPQHSVYEGHFPGQPVLPGVCTLQIIRECVGMLLQRKIRYQTIAQCKFLAMIVPSDDLVELCVILEGDYLQATVTARGLAVLKLKSTYIDIL